MLKMTIVLEGFNRKPVVLSVTEYKIKRWFLCVQTVSGKYICYNIKYIERFEVEE